MLRSRLNAGAHAGLWKNLAFIVRTARWVEPAMEHQARLAALSAR